MSARGFIFGGVAATGSTSSTGVSAAISNARPYKAVMAWLNAAGGSATVLVQKSCDGGTHWDTLDTLTLTGANGVDSTESVSAFDTIRLDVTDISGGGVVAGNVRFAHA